MALNSLRAFTARRWVDGRERLQLGHLAWRYTARATLVAIAVCIALRSNDIPRGSSQLPVSPWFAVPPLLLLSDLGFTRGNGRNSGKTTCSFVVNLILFMTLPPLTTLGVMALTDVALQLLARRQVIKTAFNASASILESALMALFLHLPIGLHSILTTPGVLQAWGTLTVIRTVDYFHTERFLEAMFKTPGKRPDYPFFTMARLENCGQDLIMAAGTVLALRAISADHQLWIGGLVLAAGAITFSLLIIGQGQHRRDLEDEREWLLAVRSPGSAGDPHLLGSAIQHLTRCTGLRLVLHGERAEIGELAEEPTGETQRLGSSVAIHVYGSWWRRLIGQPFTDTRIELTGGIAGDHIRLQSTLSLTWRIGQRITKVTQYVQDEVELALERDSQRDALELAATHDVLTGLLRPAVFSSGVNDLIAGDAAATLVLVQIGRLRQVNDLFGRHAGDTLLTLIAQRLSAALTDDGALTCRLGGHLFGVAIPGGERSRAEKIAALLAGVVSGDMPLSTDITVTVGVALAPSDGDNAEDLIRRAELGLDLATSAGTQVGFFEPAAEADAVRRLRLVPALRDALERGQVTAVYQPQVRPNDERLVGVEALARWTHPEFGFVPPDEFITLAESSGLIQPLTVAILGTALRQCKAWADAGLDVPMSVNLSARSLTDPATIPLVIQLLAETGVPAHKLTLEVTETAVMDDPARAIETLRQLRSFGLKISLDDFGTGHSSLAYLKTLPADEVKLDRGFTSNLDDPAAMALVRASVELAHALGLSIVAEGVEDQSTLDLLNGVGADVAQGYHLCRPGTPATIHDYLVGHSEHTLAASA